MWIICKGFMAHGALHTAVNRFREPAFIDIKLNKGSFLRAHLSLHDRMAHKAGFGIY
jgi:hypothetical protein